MQQMFRYVIIGFFLCICSWQDVRKREIAGEIFLIFGIMGVIVDIFFGMSWKLFITGVLPGMAVLFFGRISGQQIGYGDGLVLLVMGLLLQWRTVMATFLTGLFLCAISSIVLFFIGRAKTKMTLPFVPFLTAAFGVEVYFKVV